MVLWQPEIVDRHIRLQLSLAQLLQLYSAVRDLAPEVVSSLKAELVSNCKHIQNLFVHLLLAHKPRVQSAHVGTGLFELHSHQLLRPLLFACGVLVVVNLLAGEPQSFLEHIGEDGQVEGLRVVEGFDCAGGDAGDDLPHCQREEQAEDGRNDLADIRAIVPGLQGEAFPEEALEGGQVAVLRGGGLAEEVCAVVGLEVSGGQGLFLHVI